MLVEFTVGNFLSFKQPVTLSMVAAKINARDRQVDENTTIPIDDDLTLLTSAAIYGANASGKSNLVKALGFMRWFVLNSSKESQADEPIHVTPFRLSLATEQQPSFFEIVFVLENVTYRYGFETSNQKVMTEWLFYAPHRKEARLFVRDEKGIQIARGFKGGKTSRTLTRSNALFLSVAAQFNSETASRILAWFRSLGLISGLDDTSYRGDTASKFTEDENFRREIVRVIKESDVGIDDIVTEKSVKSDLRATLNFPSEFKDWLLKQLPEDKEIITFKTLHVKRGTDGLLTSAETFDLGDESEGTQKLFHILGPIIDTLSQGKVLVIDEIEARLHTQLTQKLVKLFNSRNTNPNRAQLIFATHDTNLLSNKLFRRDQIWFVEKDRLGASHLYSLAELKVRNDASFESDYLDGRYGAIPLFGELRQVIIEEE